MKSNTADVIAFEIGEDLGWSPEAQDFSRAIVRRVLNGRKPGDAGGLQVGTLGQIFVNQAIGVFVGAGLPGAAGVAEVDVDVQAVGIDLAKNVFAVHGVNEAGKAELARPNVARGKLGELIAALPPCTIGMEACSGAHHWARLNTVIGDLLSEIHRLDERIKAYDRHIAEMAWQDHRAQQLMRLRGIGETTATALVAMIGNGRDFRNGRQRPRLTNEVPVRVFHLAH